MEPERNIEKLLRAFAKKRRADAGDPLKLHPALRRQLQAEVARLTRELDKLEREVQRVEGKLANPAFAAKAPPEVVAKEEEKLAETRQAVQRLSEQRQRIQTL